MNVFRICALGVCSLALVACNSARESGAGTGSAGQGSIEFVSADSVREAYDGDLIATLPEFKFTSEKNGLLIVTVTWGVFDDASQVQSVVRAAQSFATVPSCLVQTPEKKLGVQMFWLVGAAPGPADIVVTFTNPGKGSIDQVSVAAVELTGVNLSAPLGPCVSAFGVDAEELSAKVPTAPGDQVVDGLYFLSEKQDPHPGLLQTERVNNRGSSVSVAMSTATAVSSTTSMTWRGVAPGVSILLALDVKPN